MSFEKEQNEKNPQAADLIKYYEKREFIIAELPDIKPQYHYSAYAVKEELDELLKGQILKKIYVSFRGYMESMHSNVNCIDLSYFGGFTLVVFDRTVLYLVFHAEGMLEYCCFSSGLLKLKKAYGYPTSEMIGKGTCFFDVSNHQISFDYIGKDVREIAVESTDAWAFSQPTFDEEAANDAADRNDLPDALILVFDSFSVWFSADQTEYYWITFRKSNLANSAPGLPD